MRPAPPGSRGAISRSAIERTDPLIRPYIRTTPVLEISGADFGLTPFSLTLKLEHTQFAGSFKTRGAFANLLLRAVPETGVAAASGGNHGAAVAYAARALGIRARIFVPTLSSPAKTRRISDYGAELIVGGGRYADALAACEAWTAQSGALGIHAFDQRETLLGQGTIGLELERQCPMLDTVLVAVGGGGLIGGLAAWYAGAAKPVKIVGVEPIAAPTLHDALRAGAPIDSPAGGVAADSLAPARVGTLMFPIARAHVSQVALVSDDAIRHAQHLLWDRVRLVAEPGAAAPLAALLTGAYQAGPGEGVCVIVSGANTTAVDFDAPPPPH